MKHYVTIKTLSPGQLLPVAIRVVPTGKVEDGKAEGICITPRTGIGKIWFTKDQVISTPRH